MTRGRVVRGDVGRARGDRHRGGEVQLLPALGGLVGERARGQLGPAGGPQGAGVGAGVVRLLVEPDPGDGPVLRGL